MLLIRYPYCEEDRPELEFRHAGEAAAAAAHRRKGRTVKSMRILVCLAILFILPMNARAQNISFGEPQTIVDALRSLGYSAELGKVSSGDPAITTTIGGYKNTIFFYECTNGASCNSIQFNCTFHLDDGVGLDKLNLWNWKIRPSKAFIKTNNDISIVADLFFGRDGVERDQFKAVVKKWEEDVARFAKHIGFQ